MIPIDLTKDYNLKFVPDLDYYYLKDFNGRAVTAWKLITDGYGCCVLRKGLVTYNGIIYETSKGFGGILILKPL